MKNELKEACINRIISAFDTMFDTSVNDEVPTKEQAITAIKKAYIEGQKHISKKNNVIHSLAESWVMRQNYKNILFDDALYDAFVTGADLEYNYTTKKETTEYQRITTKNNHDKNK